VVEGMFVDIILLHSVSHEKHPVANFKKFSPGRCNFQAIS
jgi:hypothetical protein